MHGGQHLQEVVLQDVADGAGAVVEAAAVGDVEGLRHGDLDALDVGPVEQGLEDGVGEPPEQHVLHRVEPEPVVDPVDRLLGEDRVHRLVELLGAAQVGAERLLDHDPGAVGQPRRADAVGDAAEQRRRHLQVEQDARRPCAPSPPSPGRSRRRRGRRRRSRADPSMRAAAGASGSMSLSRSDAAAYARNCSSSQPLLATPITGTSSTPRSTRPDQGGEGLQLGEVAGRAEDHQRVHRVGCHAGSFGFVPVAAQASRSAAARRMWSPTRSALAMAVSDGFTAPMLGKKLVSTT